MLLKGNKVVSSTKQDVVMELYGLPPIGQKQRRPMDGAQLHSPWSATPAEDFKAEKGSQSRLWLLPGSVASPLQAGRWTRHVAALRDRAPPSLLPRLG